MGWSIGFDETWQRDIGYGVPAVCDQPDCGTEIDRGLEHVCGGLPYGGDLGCGLYFCDQHLGYVEDETIALYEQCGGDRQEIIRRFCDRCVVSLDAAVVVDGDFDQAAQILHNAKPDVPRWTAHKLVDPSWREWLTEQTPDTWAAMVTAAGPWVIRNVVKSELRRDVDAEATAYIAANQGDPDMDWSFTINKRWSEYGPTYWTRAREHGDQVKADLAARVLGVQWWGNQFQRDVGAPDTGEVVMSSEMDLHNVDQAAAMVAWVTLEAADAV